MSKIRLHLPAIPYTITRDEYSHDAYTGKVKRFSPMMRSRGFEVYHYGVETSESGANKNFDLLTKEEWNKLRIQTLIFVDPTLSIEDATKKNEDESMVISTLSNWSSPLFIEFNKRLRIKLAENYRNTSTDIVCLPLGRSYDGAIRDCKYTLIETGIGYHGSYSNYRIFESYSWLSKTLGDEKKDYPPNYWFVIPNYFDTKEFKLCLTPNPLKVGFLGRITNVKGCDIIVEIARRFPHIQFILCGQGDPSKFLKEPNIVYKLPIHGEERSDYLGDCIAVLCPTSFLEPFCGVSVEAQLCGTPVICADSGGIVDNVEQFYTGLRCHTLADYCHGIQMALDGKFDRVYIRKRAEKLFDMYKLAYNYEYIFKSILDIHTTGKNGWYSPDNHIKTLQISNQSNELIDETTIEKQNDETIYDAIYDPIYETIEKQNDETIDDPIDETSEKQIINSTLSSQKIYLFIVYFGKLPNYFQLYLDSLEINNELLYIIFITDIDLTSYKIISVSMKINEVKSRISTLLFDIYEKEILPENLIKDNYKLVDFKIIYPILFDDIMKQNNIASNDFVGWGDCDVIYGKLSNFIDFNENYDIIGGWHGHFTAIKNIESFKYLFKNIPNYFELVTDNIKTFITDEIAYREPLTEYLKLNNCKMCYINKDFCDIVPPIFYNMIRPNHESYEKNFFNNSKPLKNINHLYYDKIQSKLITIYDDGESYETTYCHLQKRKMEISFTTYEKGFYIYENKFVQF